MLLFFGKKGGPLEKYVIESECSSICEQLNDLENWLYEDGMECDRDVYINKLQALKTLTNPIKTRADDYEQCPNQFKELKQAITFGRNAVNEFKHGSTKYDHLTEVEFLNITENCDRAQNWYDTNLNKFNQSARTMDSPVKAQDIANEIKTLNSCVNNVINRPKPKVTPAPTATATASPTAAKSSPSNKDVNAMGDDQHQNGGGGGGCGMTNDGKSTEAATNQGDINQDVNMEAE